VPALPEVSRRFPVVVLLVLAPALLVACGSGPVASAGNSNSTYGQLPSWLPKSTVPVNRVVVATVRQPRLGIEGDTMKAILPHGQTLVTVAGPTVPPFVTPPPPTTTATFTISMTHTSGTVPIRAADFELVDGNGRFVYPQTFVSRPPPALAPAGRTVSFEVTETLATGAGSIRWSPSGRPVATWDFIVEND
jgi:hypothetical protein